MIIANMNDLYRMFTGYDDPDMNDDDKKYFIERWIYKSTDCGAWINIEKEGVQIGSIVEGSDVEIVGDYLAFPFHEDNFDDVIRYVEDEAEAEWKIANEQPLKISRKRGTIKEKGD